MKLRLQRHDQGTKKTDVIGCVASKRVVEEFVPLGDAGAWREKRIRVGHGEAGLVSLLTQQAAASEHRTGSIRAMKRDHQTAGVWLETGGYVEQVRASGLNGGDRPALGIADASARHRSRQR